MEVEKEDKQNDSWEHSHFSLQRPLALSLAIKFLNENNTGKFNGIIIKTHVSHVQIQCKGNNLEYFHVCRQTKQRISRCQLHLKLEIGLNKEKAGLNEQRVDPG